MPGEARSEVIISPEGVLMFEHLFRPRADQKTRDGRPKFTATLCIKPKFQKTAQFKAMKAAVDGCIAEKWGDQKPKKLKVPFLTVEDLDKVPQGIEDGDIFIRVTAVNKPKLVDQHVQEILDESELYAGCRVRMSIQAYTWTDDKGGKGVSFGLNNVQKIGDGDHLSGGSRAEDDFDEVETDEEEDLLN